MDNLVLLSEANWIALCIPLGIFVIAACLYVILRRHFEAMGEEGYTEMISSDDDPTLKFESECRTSILNTTLACISTAWNINLDDKHLAHDTVGYNTDLVTIAKMNYIFRVYCNWNTHKIKVDLLATDDEDPQFKPLRRHVVLRVKNGFVDYSRFYAILLKWYSKYYATFISDVEDTQGYQMVLAEHELGHEITTDAAGIALLKLMAFARKANSANYDASLALLLAYIGQNTPEVYNKLANALFPEDEEEDPKSSDENEENGGTSQKTNL